DIKRVMEKTKEKKGTVKSKSNSPRVKEKKKTIKEESPEKEYSKEKGEAKTKVDGKSKKEEMKGKKSSPDGKEKFPKNINEYRHIIDTLQVKDKDLEWVLDLRTYTKMVKPLEKTNTHPLNFNGG